MIGIDRDWQSTFFFDMHKPIRTPAYPRATKGMNRRKGEHMMKMSERSSLTSLPSHTTHTVPLFSIAGGWNNCGVQILS